MMKFWPSSLMLLGLLACQPAAEPETKSKALFSQAAILAEADRYLSQEPVPLTDTLCARSEGGPQDFYSEGDYWWPDPEHPDGPYIRKDGLSNPGNFVAHRRAMRNLSRWVASLTAAYLAIEEDKYAAHALKHLRAWFLNPDTRMNPHLLYGQAIKGRVSGRGIGIIDSIHLIEVARSIQRLQEKGYLKEEEWQGLRDWFVQYTDWLTTHPYGLDEKDHGNNHSTWWAAQVAVFADLVGREDLLALCRDQFKKLLSEQMDEQGAFPDELARTKPFNYSLFNLEAYAILADVASTPEDNLWHYQAEHGSLKQSITFLLPTIQDKNQWAYQKDVEHFDELPIQSATLLLAGKAYDEPTYVELWQGLSPERSSHEIDRTYPIRQLSLWVNE